MVIFEIITGLTILSAVTGYQLVKKEPELPIYGKYCVCLTKDDNHTYIPWYNRSFKTEDEYELETEKIVKIAFSKQHNSFDKSITGIALVNLETGKEEYWCAILDTILV